MGLTPRQQIKELVKKSKNILITTHQTFSGDGLGSALAMYFILKKLKKNVEVVIPRAIPSQLSFLPNTDQINHRLSGIRDFILQIDTAENKIAQLRYEAEGTKLNIYLTPKSQRIEKEDINLIPGKYKYDLIIVLDSYDLEQLGKIYEEHTELFFDTPVINIDHHASNEYFGEVNLVEVTATSTCEIIHTILDSFGPNLMDEKIALSLLTGIIADTESFQSPSTTPRAFTIAASLIANGANQQEIIRHLYKNKHLPALKLWGRIMSRLQYDSQHKLAWSAVTKEDFKKTNAQLADLDSVLKELVDNSPDVDAVLLLHETNNKHIEGIIQVIKNINQGELAKLVNGKAEHNKITFSLAEDSLVDAENHLLPKIRQFRSGLKKK